MVLFDFMNGGGLHGVRMTLSPGLRFLASTSTGRVYMDDCVPSTLNEERSEAALLSSFAAAAKSGGWAMYEYSCMTEKSEAPKVARVIPTPVALLNMKSITRE